MHCTHFQVLHTNMCYAISKFRLQISSSAFFHQFTGEIKSWRRNNKGLIQQGITESGNCSVSYLFQNKNSPFNIVQVRRRKCQSKDSLRFSNIEELGLKEIKEIDEIVIFHSNEKVSMFIKKDSLIIDLISCFYKNMYLHNPVAKRKYIHLQHENIMHN